MCHQLWEPNLEAKSPPSSRICLKTKQNKKNPKVFNRYRIAEISFQN